MAFAAFTLDAGEATPPDPSGKDKPKPIAEVIVEGRAEDLIGEVASASQGKVGNAQLEARPISRVGEVLEAVPGLIATQHSGSGKANQFFFRGINLDHGTDFATHVMGMPVNMRSHGHGQGYTDLNFVIPELIRNVEYRKGPYYAAEGDFAATGAAHIEYFRQMPHTLAEITGGEFGYARTVVASTPKFKGGNLLTALELERNDGPWKHSERERKINAVIGYSKGDESLGWQIMGMGYSNAWTSTDQIPKRAVKSGQIDRFAGIDNSDGGRSMRFSLSGEWHQESKTSATRVSAYVMEYQMNLWSNFTYFLDDSADGDQFEQEDKRIHSGLRASHSWFHEFNGRPVETTVGLQARRDDILDLGLYHTVSRARLETIRDDTVQETSVSPYFESKVQWLEKLRTVFGLRGDVYFFNVHSTDANSGSVTDSIVSPKASIIMGPWHKTEFYLNFGLGFHSNDARGTTTKIDPGSGDTVEAVEPLVRATGTEFGIRTTFIPHLNSTLAVWLLDFESELLFVGDAGTTVASRPSRRAGIEFANYYTPLDWLTFDFDLSLSRARFTNSDPSGKRIPGSIEGVIATGFSVDHKSGFFGGARLRYFGPRPLIEDNSVRSSSTTLLTARAGYNINKNFALYLDGFNLLDRQDSDIDYFYESQLAGEGGPVEDIHFHPVEPRQFRLTLRMKW